MPNGEYMGGERGRREKLQHRKLLFSLARVDKLDEKEKTRYLSIGSATPGAQPAAESGLGRTRLVPSPTSSGADPATEARGGGVGGDLGGTNCNGPAEAASGDRDSE